jgi:DNA-binding LacI/PurR family transcriptional regulator
MNLVGFDGMLRWLPEGGNLTTACQNFERIGQLAAELAMKRMANGPTETYQHYLLEAPLLVRGSTSPR